MSRSRTEGSGGNQRGTRASFGSIRKLQSGRFQARYTGPDGGTYRAPVTFQARGDARAWLALRQSEILRSEWMPEDTRRAQQQVVTFGEYADEWLKVRTLKPRTHNDYQRLLDQRLRPRFGDLPLPAITRADVRTWHAEMGTGQPTLRSHAYGLLRTILGSAVSDELITVNPAHIRGAGNVRRVKKIKPASLQELAELVEAMPERYKAMTLLAAWCALRFGELTELRRRDLDLETGVIHIRRAVVRVRGEFIVDTPKSHAGVRDVAIPPHLISMLARHLAEYVGNGADVLLFPSADGKSHMAPSSLYRVFYRARAAAGRDDLRWHDLRHTGAVLAAATGATLAELMGRLGHSTPGAALRYQHAAEGRDQQIATALTAIFDDHHRRTEAVVEPDHEAQ